MSTNRRTFLKAGVGLLAGTAVSGFAAPGGRASHDHLLFGLIADPQYVDAERRRGRFYRESIGKLHDCVEQLNGHELRFVAHVGDAIDRDFASFDPVVAEFDRLRAPLLHALGNHDYLVEPTKKRDVPDRLGMKANYYERRDLLPGWRILVLDGNEVSTFAHPPDSPRIAEAEQLLQQLRAGRARNGNDWNGGVGPEQLRWLDDRLAEADAAGERALLLCHYPVYPVSGFNLLNAEAVREIIDRHACVAAYINGHHHAGDYAVRDDVHYLTLRGMVETRDRTAYAIAELTPDRLKIHGRGREPSRDLPLRPRLAS